MARANRGAQLNQPEHSGTGQEDQKRHDEPNRETVFHGLKANFQNGNVASSEDDEQQRDGNAHSGGNGRLSVSVAGEPYGVCSMLLF